MSAIDAFEQAFGRDHEWGDLRDARLESCTLEGVVWSGKDLRGALFGQTKLAGTDFRHATGWRIRPDENRMRGAKFRRDGLEGLLSAYDLDLE